MHNVREKEIKKWKKKGGKLHEKKGKRPQKCIFWGYKLQKYIIEERLIVAIVIFTYVQFTLNTRKEFHFQVKFELFKVKDEVRQVWTGQTKHESVPCGQLVQDNFQNFGWKISQRTCTLHSFHCLQPFCSSGNKS